MREKLSIRCFSSSSRTSASRPANLLSSSKLAFPMFLATRRVGCPSLDTDWKFQLSASSKKKNRALQAVARSWRRPKTWIKGSFDICRISCFGEQVAPCSPLTYMCWSDDCQWQFYCCCWCCYSVTVFIAAGSDSACAAMLILLLLLLPLLVILQTDRDRQTSICYNTDSRLGTPRSMFVLA